MIQKLVNINKKWRLPKWLLILVMIPLIIIAIHFHFYFSLKEQFHADKSVNQKATSYFLHATALYVVWIDAPHRYLHLSYDSFLMKSFISWRNYLFTQGEQHLADNNAEDSMWWFQNYFRFYGFTRGDTDNVYKFENLDMQQKQDIANKLYLYIEKLGSNEIKGVYAETYGEPIVVLSNYVGAYLRAAGDIHDGATEQEKTKNFYLDKGLTSRLIKVDGIYKKALSEMTTMKHKRYYYLYYRFTNLDNIIFGKMFQYQNEGYPEILCRTTWMQDYINIFRELEIWSQDKSIQKDNGDREHTRLFKSIALDNDEHKVSTYILVAIDKHCQNYDVKDLLQYKRKEK